MDGNASVPHGLLRIVIEAFADFREELRSKRKYERADYLYLVEGQLRDLLGGGRV